MIVWLALALAADGTVLVLPTSNAPDSAALAKHLGKELARSDLTIQPSDLLESEDLRDALRVHPGECEPWLSEDHRADLFDRHMGGGELYLALSVSPRPNDTLLWSYDAATNGLIRVQTRKPPTVAPATPPERLLLLAWPDIDQTLKDVGREAELLNPEFVEHTDAALPLLDVLMRTPEACHVSLEGEALELAIHIGEDVFGDLVFAAVPPGEKRALLWRWEPSDRSARRVMLD